MYAQLSHADRYVTQGMKLYGEEEYERAIVEFERALSLDSLQLRAYVFLTSSYLNVKHPSRAEDIARSGLRWFPHNTDLQFLLAESLLPLQMLDDALAVYIRLLDSIGKGDVKGFMNIKTDYLKQRIGHIHLWKGEKASYENETMDAIRSYTNALNYIPDSLVVYHNLAYLYLQKEQWSNALEIVGSGMKLYPNNQSLLRMKAYAAYRLNDLTKLESAYEKLYVVDPRNIDDALTYAEILLQNQKVLEAYAMYETLLERHPRERKVYRALIDLYARQLNLRAKLEILKRKMEAFPYDLEILRRIAETNEYLGRWEDARAVYDTLLRETGDTLQIYMAKAQTFLEEYNLESAMMLYESLYYIYPEDHELLYLSGKLYEKLERWEEALDMYEKLTSLSEDPHSYQRMGWIYENLDQPELAMQSYQNALDAHTNHPLPYYRLSKLLTQRDGLDNRSYKLALKAVRTGFGEIKKIQEEKYGLLMGKASEVSIDRLGDSRVIAEQLDDLNEVTEEGFYYFIRKFSPEKVTPVIEELLFDYPGSTRLYYLAGTYYQMIGDVTNALQCFTESVEVNPEFRESHVALGKIYESKGDIQQSIISYERAISLDPEEADAYRALINLYRKNGNLDALCDRWLARYRSRSDNAVLREHLIEALHKAGRHKEAREIIEDRQN